MREEYERDLHHAWMILETDELCFSFYYIFQFMERSTCKTITCFLY